MSAGGVKDIHLILVAAVSTVLLAGAAGATFTGVAVSHPEVDHHGPYDGGVDTGGMDGGGE